MGIDQSKKRAVLSSRSSGTSGSKATHATVDLPVFPTDHAANSREFDTVQSLSCHRSASALARSAVWTGAEQRTFVASGDAITRSVLVWDMPNEVPYMTLKSNDEPVIDIHHVVCNNAWYRENPAFLAALSHTNVRLFKATPS